MRPWTPLRGRRATRRSTESCCARQADEEQTTPRRCRSRRTAVRARFVSTRSLRDHSGSRSSAQPDPTRPPSGARHFRCRSSSRRRRSRARRRSLRTRAGAFRRARRRAPVPMCNEAGAPIRGPADPGPCAWHETRTSASPCRETWALNAYLPAGSVPLARTVVAVSEVVPLISTAFAFRASKAFGRPPASPLSPLTPGGPWNPRGPRAPRGPLGPRACFDDFPTCTTFVTVFCAAFPSGVAPSRATTSAAAASATAMRCKALLKLAPCRALAYPIAKVTRTVAEVCCLPGSIGADGARCASAAS